MRFIGKPRNYYWTFFFSSFKYEFSVCSYSVWSALLLLTGAGDKYCMGSMLYTHNNVNILIFKKVLDVIWKLRILVK